MSSLYIFPSTLVTFQFDYILLNSALAVQLSRKLIGQIPIEDNRSHVYAYIYIFILGQTGMLCFQRKLFCYISQERVEKTTTYHLRDVVQMIPLGKN